MAEPNDDEYELLPHKEIEELKEELAKLKEFEIAPSKKMQVSLLELNTKLDKLLTIFEDAAHEMRVEEGGMSFVDKMRPMLEKMNKILEQNAEIASGILALADMVKEVQTPKPESRFESKFDKMDVDETPEPAFNLPPRKAPMVGATPPNVPPGVPPGLPLPPLPKRRTFGL